MEIICIIIGIIGLIISLSVLGIYVIFTKFPGYTAKTGAFLYLAKQKNNVTVRCIKGSDVFVKNLTKGYYQYKVGDKLYKVKDTHYFSTKRQAPKIISIVYLKRFPRIFYINEAESCTDLNYLIYGMIGAFVSISLIVSVIFLFI